MPKPFPTLTLGFMPLLVYLSQLPLAQPYTPNGFKQGSSGCVVFVFLILNFLYVILLVPHGCLEVVVCS